jgi:hypothetical protein
MNGIDKYAPGKQLYFPYTGNTYVITAVDDAAQTVTFALPFDLEDATTETIAAIESVDVRVLPALGVGGGGAS